jgi:hypothetical protein
VDGAHDQQERGHHDHQCDVVHREVVRQVDDAEELAARHALQAVFAAGEPGLQRDEEHHLRERQRDHREVDALAADGHDAEDPAEEGAAQGAGDEAQLGREAPDLHGMARHIRRAAQEGRMAEGQQARETQQQVERRGEQREAHELHHEHRVGAEERRRDERDQQQCVDDGGDLFHVHAVRLISLCRTGRRGESGAR